MSDTPATQPASLTARQVLKTLQDSFPVIGDAQPLAIGIDKQIIAKQPEINRKLLRMALSMHVKSVRYLKNLQHATQRVNLDGTPANDVSDEQREHASGQLHERFKKQAEVRKAQREAEEAERRHSEKLQQLQDKFGRK